MTIAAEHLERLKAIEPFLKGFLRDDDFVVVCHAIAALTRESKDQEAMKSLCEMRGPEKRDFILGNICGQDAYYCWVDLPDMEEDGIRGSTISDAILSAAKCLRERKANVD